MTTKPRDVMFMSLDQIEGQLDFSGNNIQLSCGKVHGYEDLERTPVKLSMVLYIDNVMNPFLCCEVIVSETGKVVSWIEGDKATSEDYRLLDNYFTTFLDDKDE